MRAVGAVPALHGCIACALQSACKTKSWRLHPRSLQIPSLVLDCDANVDVERDQGYRERVISMVRELGRAGTLAVGVGCDTFMFIAMMCDK